MFEIIKFKYYQKTFCKEFIDHFHDLPEYCFFLKHAWEKSQLKYGFFHVAVYDVLDNKGFQRLINCIYKLKKNKQLEIDTHYINHKYKKIDYIHSNFDSISFGNICTVKTKEHKWFSEIDVSYTNNNNSEIIVCYDFVFKKTIASPVQIHRFVQDEIQTCKKGLFFYTLRKNSLQKMDYKDLAKTESILFSDILQSYICKWFFTSYGDNYKLPVEFCCKLYRYNRIVKKELNNSFLCLAYERHNIIDEHIIIDKLRLERCIVFHAISGRSYPDVIMRDYFGYFSTEMYYNIFDKIESDELEHHMRKYLNSRKKFISSRDIKWLINKLRYINEQSQKIESSLDADTKTSMRSSLGWKLFVNGEIKEYDIVNYPEYTEYYKNHYEESLEYLKSISATQNDKVIIVITALTFAATLIGVLASIFVPIIINNIQK